MKKQLFTLAFAIATIVAFSQNGTKAVRIQAANFSQTESGFNTVALKAASGLDCCWSDTCKCTDLKDPWEAKGLTYDQQINSIAKDKRATQTQKNLAAFEKAIMDGKGKKKLTAKHVKDAFAKHPGYSKDAMSKRFDIYILSLESETEDE